MKSRDRKRGRARAEGRSIPTPIEPTAVPTVGSGTRDRAVALDAAAASPPAPDVFDRWFVPIALGILLVAAALRLPELALNPFHHDEGVNGFFTTNLVRQGVYHYDPQNYHGPSLYYFALLSEVLFGLTTEAMRLVPVVFGMLLVGLVFPLRRYLGSVATLVAAALLAVSPGAVYVSRYFIHESLLVAMTLALVVSTLFYLERRKARYLVAVAVSAALLFTTKETAVITIAILLLAVAVAHVYLRIRDGSLGAGASVPRGRRPGARQAAVPQRSVWIDGVEYRPARGSGPATGMLGDFTIPAPHLAGAIALFVVIYVLLFTSFFTNPQGLVDSFTAYIYWFQHGDATQIQPIWQYLVWIHPADDVILVLGVVGGLIAAIRAPSRVWVIVGLWAAGISVGYSVIQYKTPWILLNMLLPLALLGGLAIAELWRSRFRLAAPVVVAGALAASGFMAIDLNFNHYDDETYKYVYVHSTRQMLALVDEIEATADRAGTGRDTGIVIVSPDYWPLPWYLRDYPRAGFFGSIVETQEAEIVANVNQEAELAPAIADRYHAVGTYNLRPGVDLVLYVRNDVPE